MWLFEFQKYSKREEVKKQWLLWQGENRVIYFHRKLKLFRDALKNLQNFSKIIIKTFRNYGWKLKFLSIFSCFRLNTHFLHKKVWIFWKNHQNFSTNLPNFKTFPWWLSQPNEKYSSLGEKARGVKNCESVFFSRQNRHFIDKWVPFIGWAISAGYCNYLLKWWNASHCNLWNFNWIKSSVPFVITLYTSWTISS